MAGRWAGLTDGVRRRLGDLAPRERRALAVLLLAVAAFVVGTVAFLVQTGLSERKARNAGNAAVLRLVREKGKAYRDRLALQDELNRRLAADLPSLPSILGEVLGELGQQRQDFQELPPEAVGPAGQKRKPWLRLSVKFPLRKVSAQAVYEFLLKLRERYPDLPLAVTSLEMHLDQTENALYRVDMVVSAYRLAEPKAGTGTEKAPAGAGRPGVTPAEAARGAVVP
jgi:hypothetical protein